MATAMLKLTIPAQAIDWDEVKAAGLDADASRAAFVAEVEAEARKVLPAITEVDVNESQLPTLYRRYTESETWFNEGASPVVQQAIDRVLARETWIRS